MTRVTDNQLSRTILLRVQQNRAEYDRYSHEVSTGYKVSEPGDSTFSGSISQLKSILERSDLYQNRIKAVEGELAFQDTVLDQANQLLVRTKELASQAANETNNAENRQTIAEEVFQIRDQMVQLANSQFKGRFVYAGFVDNTAPYTQGAYANGTGESAERWVYTNADGATGTRSVNVTDNLTVTTNTPGSTVFNGAIQALERLGRALDGFRTDPDAVDGNGNAVQTTPDGTGTAYDLTLAADVSEQTDDILNALDLLELARVNDVNTERVDLNGRINRLESARSVLDISSQSAQEGLSQLQDADVIESASKLTLAQTALEASLSVTSRVLNLTVLDYL